MVAHVQAKDVEIDEAARTRYGVFGRTVGRTSPADVGWWRYRVPGRGRLDWNRLIDVLYDAGYEGTVAVEHEEPVWGGTLDRTQQGLRIAEATLRPLIVPERPCGLLIWSRIGRRTASPPLPAGSFGQGSLRWNSTRLMITDR
jgi:hypothetical protein